MKKKFYPILLMIATVMLQSCEFDDNGNASLSGLGWIIIVGVIVFVIIGVIGSNSTHDAAVKKMEEEGISFEDFKAMGTYIGGHPSINESKKGVYAFKKDQNILLYTQIVPGYDKPVLIPNSELPVASIKDIKLEDASSIERRITVGRLLLVGVFAFAWKKKKVNETAFVTIIWDKGRFEQETTFMFEGKDALQKANTARNELMILCD